VVEKFEVGIGKINYNAIETLSKKSQSVEKVQRDRRPTLSSTKTASRSVQPFLQGSLMTHWQTTLLSW